MASILMVADSMAIGGAERHVIGLSAHLVRAGHDVRLLCSAGGPLLCDAVDAGIEVRLLGEQLVKRRVSKEFTTFVGAELDRRPPTIVHAHMFASAAAAAGAMKCQPCPLIVTEHSEALWRTPADSLAARMAYDRSAAVIAVSAAIGRRLVDCDGVGEDRVFVIPNALLETRPRVRRSATKSPVVGVVARLRPEKGIDVFLRAAAAVALVMPSARFVVVGDGPERGRLAHQAVTLGLDVGRLEFLGARTDGPELLAGFDVAAVPSLGNEGTPLVVLEALAAGVPLVASRTGGIPEQVREGLDALLVEPGDADALANALLEVLADPHHARKRATAARRQVTTRFGLQAMGDAVEDVYLAATSPEFSRMKSRRRTTTRATAGRMELDMLDAGRMRTGHAH